jgi:dipeptidyl aminopeptidase/acylaminoacyl peptidase
LYGVDKIETPLLIMQGGDDWLRPQSETLFAALKRLDKPAQLAIYEGCGHWIAAWPKAQAIASTERILEFFGRHLAKP